MLLEQLIKGGRYLEVSWNYQVLGKNSTILLQGNNFSQNFYVLKIGFFFPFHKTINKY